MAIIEICSYRGEVFKKALHVTSLFFVKYCSIFSSGKDCDWKLLHVLLIIKGLQKIKNGENL